MILPPQEAAVLLGVRPETISAWEFRFGCPRSRPMSDGGRGYDHADLVALRVALDETFSVAAAVSRVMNGATVSSMRGAARRFG